MWAFSYNLPAHRSARGRGTLTEETVLTIVHGDEWTTVIRPCTGWPGLGWRELVQSRELIALLVWRDLVATYQQTILGPVWHLLQPLLSTITFTIVFGHIVRLPTEGVPHFLFYLVGIVAWSYFSGSVLATANIFSAQAHLFGKVYFPRLVVPIAIVLSRAMPACAQLILALIVVGYYAASGSTVSLTANLLFVPLLLGMLALFSVTVGTLVSALTIRYRDLQHLVTFGITLMMFVTPVLYPVSVVPTKYRSLLVLNPAASIIEAFRRAVLGTAPVELRPLFVSLSLIAGLAIVSLFAFRRAEAAFIDTV